MTTIPMPTKKPMPERKRESPLETLLKSGEQAHTPPAIRKYAAAKGIALAGQATSLL
jgi:hypothetical protein